MHTIISTSQRREETTIPQKKGMSTMPATKIVRILLARARKSNSPIGRKVSFTLHGMTRNDNDENKVVQIFMKEFDTNLECGGTKNNRHFSFVLTEAMKKPIKIIEEPRRERFIRRYVPTPSFAYQN